MSASVDETVPGDEGHGIEPPMYLQRPSSARSQDISHILARTFRELYTRQAVGQDTVHYLNKSKGGEDEFHEKYVEALRKVQEEHEHRMAETAMLERHIMQAQARAMSADERQLNRTSAGIQRFPDLGLPPSRSHFQSCIDTQLLRKYNLITPEDFATEESPIVPPPQAPLVPNYARETQSSNRKKNEDQDPKMQTPLPPIRGSCSDLLSSSQSASSIASVPAIGQSMPHVNLWKEQMNPEEREINRNDLANLEARVNYLKNPRHIPPSAAGGGRTLIKSHKKHPKEVGKKPKPEKEPPKEPSVVFIPTPNVVTFTQYTVGQVFEMTLELKNVTTVLRPLRVIPPRTSYFSVGLGQFPGEHGVVAPGMSCHYTVKFAPDSLGDFDDQLIVQTQSSQPLVIQLQGRRQPPALTLSENIDVGQCLVGGCKMARLFIKNEGGPGRFCMMPQSSWPAANFKSTVVPACVSLEPFEVRPAVFELVQNDSMVLEVLFTPAAVQTYTQTLTMVCDNCQVKHFTVTGEGQTAGVELVSVEDDLSNPLPGELCDVSATHLVRFEPLNPYTYYPRTLKVQNKANVEIPFNWVVIKPLLNPPDPEAGEEKPSTDVLQERIQDSNSPFSIDPQEGVLPANGTAEFVLTFAPPEVNDYHSVLHLLLRDIPQVTPSTTEQDGGQLEKRSQTNLPPAEPSIQDMTALELEVKGTCEPFSVILQPYAIYIPGQILVQSATKRPFRMVNNSMTSVVFEWEKCHSTFIMEVDPPMGEIGPQSEMDFVLNVSSSQPGKVNHTLLCHVHHMEEPLTLHVEADIKGPEVVIEKPDLNLGLIQLGEVVQSEVTLRNNSQVAARWSLKEASTHNKGDSEFTFWPSSGTLRPLETTNPRITFKPKSCKSVRTVFELSVEDGNECALSVRAEVQKPSACLLSCNLEMPEVYVDVPIIQQVSLLNQTLLPTTFKWGELEGSQAELCSVAVEQDEGTLGPREQLDMNVYFTAHRQIEVGDLRMPCHIGGMEKPLYLAFTCGVQGLSVEYKTPSEGQQQDQQDGNSPKEEELILDFGSSVKIGESPMRRLHIKNNSAIAAPFVISVEEFITKPPTPPDRKPPGFMPNKGQRRAMLGKTPNLADPLSKTPGKAKTDLSKAMLQVGKGVAFSAQPSSGVLQPFGEQVIEVTAFADMWGQYEDQLICKVEKLDLVYIPVKLGVEGCPLQFQMVAAQPAQKPILRFGTHVSGVPSITRQMRINNSSPYDVRLDWQTFNIDQTDNQLLDFIVTYGKPFPLLDSNGQEIVPTPEADKESTPRIRAPTDLIPDSAYTTPTISRQATETSIITNQNTENDTADNTARTEDTEQTEPEQPSQVEAQPQPESPRPKVVSVTLREHGGKQATKPYNIVPSQVIIPARGNGCINVTFTPPPNDDVTQGTDCIAYALGYLSVQDKGTRLNNKATWPQAYDIQPLRLDMTAHVKPALLTIECTDDEGMQYRAAASDLLVEGRLVPEKLHICSATLSNHTETPLMFRLLSQEPFQLVSLDPVTGLPIAQLLQTGLCTLNPRQNILVQVAFSVSMDLLEYLEMLKDTEHEHEGVELEVKGHERKLHFTHDLVVEFNNNTFQKLPLYATLTIPTLVLSKDSLDFGTCLVGQCREMQLMLSNPTSSDSFWTAVIEEKSETCEMNTFEVTPDSGMLDAHITHISNSKVLIKVFFTAKHTEAYEATVTFQGMLGEVPCQLHLKGQGSYDGKHEALVNV